MKVNVNDMGENMGEKMFANDIPGVMAEITTSLANLKNKRPYAT